MLKQPLFSPAQPRRAGVGRVKNLACLSILREHSSVAPHTQTIEILARRHDFQHPVKKRIP